MSGDQLEGEVPQAFGVMGIDRIACLPTSKVGWAPRNLLCLIAIFKLTSRDTSDLMLSITLRRT